MEKSARIEIVGTVQVASAKFWSARGASRFYWQLYTTVSLIHFVDGLLLVRFRWFGEEDKKVKKVK